MVTPSIDRGEVTSFKHAVGGSSFEGLLALGEVCFDESSWWGIYPGYRNISDLITTTTTTNHHLHDYPIFILLPSRNLTYSLILTKHHYHYISLTTTSINTHSPQWQTKNLGSVKALSPVYSSTSASLSTSSVSQH
jgi:hypothetical protein